ncbi:eukaryotic translation initiation factor 2C, 2 [Haplosporangium sp. Z 27]|nr:eukaryotic translation initiation factor 2C, 2 [Haplosporangium sp. Z 27]
MSALQLTDYVKRPSVGKAGRQIQVRSNFFEITQLPNITIHHYDMSVTPDVPPLLNRKIFDQFITLYRESDLEGTRPVFDGRKNMFSPKKFPFESRTFEVILPGDVNNRRAASDTPSFKIKIKKAATINLEELHRFLQGKSSLTNNCLTAIMSLDVLIRHKPSMAHVTIGRAFYTPTAKQPLAGPLDAWRGYYQSVRPTSDKMMINIDITATAFFQSGPLIEMVVKILGVRTSDDLRRTAPPLNWMRVEKTIKGLRIQVSHRQKAKKILKIFGLTKTSARDTIFKLSTQSKDGAADDTSPTERDIDIVSYFKQTYNITLSYPSLPCVTVGKYAILPLEVCTIVEGQRFMKKLDERQTADMIKFTSQPPSVRANNIKDGVKLLNYEGNEYINDFGMKISNEMAIVKARILQAPTIQYHPRSPREASFVPRNGSWNLKDKKVCQGATLGSWGVVVFGSDREAPESQIKGFLRELILTFTDMGLNIVNKIPPVVYSSPQGNIESILKSAWIQTGNAVKSQPQLLVCVLFNTGKPLYAEIKRVTDTVLGVSSQCIQSKHTRDPKKQYCANVCLKVNVKLGGMNSQLAPGMIPFCTSKPTILIGGDVSHPQPGDTTRPSVAALVGSMDSKASRYAATIRIQTARTETIADLGDMIIELLKTFYQTCGDKPARILFYRDGVSEGQFAEVLKTEIAAIRAACLRLDANYKPDLTFVVVQKRHHTRFFPMKPGEGDQLGNCNPGTVIDTDIVHPFEFDFYLQSHAGLLGTSRPAHYYVLLDDNKFTPDELQELTYRLCHLYARCTRTVSLVPPAYYAHLVAARARYHARGDHFSDTVSSSSAGGSVGDSSSYASVNPLLSKVMWFM